MINSGVKDASEELELSKSALSSVFDNSILVVVSSDENSILLPRSNVDNTFVSLKYSVMLLSVVDSLLELDSVEEDSKLGAEVRCGENINGS